jgi:hypothetical protein
MDTATMSLREITDRLQILDVYSRYGVAIDDRRRDLLEQVFDEETELASSDPSVPPRKGLVANWDRLVARHAATEFRERRITAAPVILTLTEDRCEALAECAIFLRPAGGPIRFEMLGLYHDTLVKRDGRWRFRTRFFDAVR